MPNVASTIRKQLNVPTFNVTNESTTEYDSDKITPGDFSHPIFCNKFSCFIKEGHKLGKIDPLFKRITDADVKLWKEKFAGVQDPAAAAAAAAASADVGAKAKKPKDKKAPKEKKVDAAATPASGEAASTVAPVKPEEVSLETK